jgi:hypothetical protein
MEKIIILMWLCTATATLNCKQIKTERVYFTEPFDCLVYGYSQSARLLRDFGREDVNKLKLTTKFLCIPGPKITTPKTFS